MYVVALPMSYVMVRTDSLSSATDHKKVQTTDKKQSDCVTLVTVLLNVLTQILLLPDSKRRQSR